MFQFSEVRLGIQIYRNVHKHYKDMAFENHSLKQHTRYHLRYELAVLFLFIRSWCFFFNFHKMSSTSFSKYDEESKQYVCCSFLYYVKSLQMFSLTSYCDTNIITIDFLIDITVYFFHQINIEITLNSSVSRN